jgi:hypothetical protein
VPDLAVLPLVHRLLDDSALVEDPLLAGSATAGGDVAARVAQHVSAHLALRREPFARVIGTFAVPVALVRPALAGLGAPVAALAVHLVAAAEDDPASLAAAAHLVEAHPHADLVSVEFAADPTSPDSLEATLDALAGIAPWVTRYARTPAGAVTDDLVVAASAAGARLTVTIPAAGRPDEEPTTKAITALAHAVHRCVGAGLPWRAHGAGPVAVCPADPDDARGPVANAGVLSAVPPAHAGESPTGLLNVLLAVSAAVDGAEPAELAHVLRSGDVDGLIGLALVTDVRRTRARITALTTPDVRTSAAELYLVGLLDEADQDGIA